jgi:ATP-dependent DNA helicase RecG
MRPAVLNPLFASLKMLKGIGEKLAKPFGRLFGREEPRVIDLLFHLPYSAIDRRSMPKLSEVAPDTVVTLEVKVLQHLPGRGRAPYKICTEQGVQTLDLVYFHMTSDRAEKTFPVGATRYVSGLVTQYNNNWQMTHPDRVGEEKDLPQILVIEPVYSLTEGLAAGTMRRTAAAALPKIPDLPEWSDPAFLAQKKFIPFSMALQRMHAPQEVTDVSPESVFRARLAYDELLSHQLSLALLRVRIRRETGRKSAGDGRLREKIEAALPFSLTGAQQTAIQEIIGDLSSEHRMLRLLQGDVGSGKTVVALMAAANVIEAGRQAAIMAPTEILARQHFERIAPLAKSVGIRLAILTGRERGREREQTLAQLLAGDIDLLVGTHALFQEGVEFRDLAFAVVDEQHRFGVHQRLALTAKGEAVDLLVMTATPIPRTLVLTFFGDMEVSELRSKPAGRQPIDTRTVSLGRIEEVVEAVGRGIKDGARAYWICPLIEESELVDLAAAEDRYSFLKERFGKAVGLVHGRMKPAEKDAAMEKFARGEIQILVSTTVVEVGVDVPEATIMVIEHAERFGLAQLHQLRGRVGRGTGQSICLLLYKTPLGESAKRRLTTMRDTEDGFRIAEEDLALRGEGEVLGTRQSGLPGFKIANLEQHGALLEAARKDAALILSRDPMLASERGGALRILLHLFEREDAVRLIEAG